MRVAADEPGLPTELAEAAELEGDFMVDVIKLVGRQHATMAIYNVARPHSGHRHRGHRPSSGLLVEGIVTFRSAEDINAIVRDVTK
jgi:hypothetical protein